MTITLESSIIHILNTAEEYPILSNRPFPLDSEVKDYLTKTIEKTISSDDVKNCFFRSETNIWQQCKDVSWNLISVSQSIAKEMFIIMRRNKEIPVADLLFGIANVDSHRYFFMLKLDYRSAFTHFVKTIDSQISIRFLYKGIIIKHNKTEPTYTKTSLFLCEKRRFLWPGLRKEGNLFKLAGPGGLAFFHLTKKEVSKWPMKK